MNGKDYYCYLKVYTLYTPDIEPDLENLI